MPVPDVELDNLLGEIDRLAAMLDAEISALKRLARRRLDVHGARRACEALRPATQSVLSLPWEARAVTDEIRDHDRQRVRSGQ